MKPTLTFLLFCALFCIRCSQNKKADADKIVDTSSGSPKENPWLEKFSANLRKIQDSDFVPSDSLFSGFSFRMDANDFRMAKSKLKTQMQNVFSATEPEPVYLLKSPFGLIKATTLNAYYQEGEGLKGLLIVALDSQKQLVSKARTVWGKEDYGAGTSNMWLKNNWNVEIAEPSNLPKFTCLMIYDAKRSKVGYKYRKID